MALAYLTINLDAFTGDDHPPISQYSTITLDPGADHIDAAADVIHVRSVVVSLDQQGKAASANGVACVDGRVPVVAGVAYAVSAPNVLRGGPHYVPALTAAQVVDLSDYITPGAPLTPDQAAALAARVTALEDAPPGGGGGGSLTYVTANTDIPDGTTPGQLVGYYNASAGSITVEGGTVAAGAHVILMWTGTAWQVLGTSGGGGTVTPTDTTPPTTVTGLTVTAITDTTATVSWTASTDAESSVSYKWRAYPTGTTAPAYADTTALTVDLTGLLSGTDYTVEVYALSAGGPSASATSATFTTTVPVSPFLRLNYTDTASITETGNDTDGWAYAYNGTVNGVALLSHMGVPFGADGAMEVRIDGITTNDPAFAIGLSTTPFGYEGGTNMVSAWKALSPNYRILVPGGHGASDLVTATSTPFANGDIVRVARVGGSTVFSVSKDNRETWIDLYTKVESFDGSLHPSIRPYYGSVANYSNIRHAGMTEWGDLDGALASVRMTIPAGTTGITESGSAGAGWAYVCDNTTGDPAASVSTYGNAANSNALLATIEGITPGTPSAKVWFSDNLTGSGTYRISLWVDAAGVLQWDAGVHGSGSLAGQTFTDSVRLASVIIPGSNKIAWSRDGRTWRTTTAFDGSWNATARSVLASAPASKGTVRAKVAIRK